ncbi:helix-turn-helix domain-containing protein [Sphaerisporangium perillae]|uniref:helix-turn-helix domain-containing protein n=1 Tax=Sphaerisporangium perillae TaxID=2935860 RepID=UPI00200D2E71|nr:helix-turn-helix domain-containing protein [Sphaerisporangium perillae]
MTTRNSEQAKDGRTVTEAWARATLNARAAYSAVAAGRREDYAWLRTEQHHTMAQAAERIGVTYRTAQRWERLRRLRNEDATS